MNDKFKPDIWRLQAQSDTQGLINALSSDDTGVRRRAAAALSALGAYDAIPALEKALATEADSTTRSHFQMVLVSLRQEQRHQNQAKAEDSRLGESETAPISAEMQRLLDDLKSDDEDTVVRTIQQLKDKGNKVAVEPLIVIFNDPDTPVRVRLAVAEALLQLESAPVEVALLGALRSESARVRRNAAAILGQLRAEWAVQPLIRALSDESHVVRRTAYAALKYIGTTEAINALIVIKQRARSRQRDREATTTSQNKALHWPKSRQDATRAPTEPLDASMITGTQVDDWQNLTSSEQEESQQDRSASEDKQDDT